MKYSSAINHTSKPDHGKHQEAPKADSKRGSTNFFKELTSSLYDPKAGQIIQSRQSLSNQAASQAFLLSPGASASGNLFVPARKLNVASKSPSTANVEILQQKIVTLKKKISSTAAQQ